MTVSPQWPQDGNRQPSVGGNGVESDDTLDLPVLPPTLFELRNLNQEARGHANTDLPSVNQSPANQAFQGSTNSDDEPRSPIPPAVSSNVSTSASAARTGASAPSTANEPENARAPERNPIPRDQPAGRTWMERIGSHSVVVVLLLVVIAAGLVIGRNSRNQGFDSSLANSSDLLDFDEGTELELPLPKHDYNQQTNTAATAEAESSAQSQVPGVSALEPSGTLTNTIVASDVAPSLSQKPAADGATVDADILADSAAWLNDPRTDLPRTDLAATGDADADRVEVDNVNDGFTNVDFMAASNRIPAETSFDTLPTLDDLDDQPSGAGGLPMPDARTPVPQLSKTPAPIIDWRLYLPKEEPATADTNVPLTSN